MGFIGDVIGGVIGAVISGLIAIYISQKSIKQERKERYKEKLQDRKDIWLNEHYRELSIEFKNLTNFNSSIVTREGKEDVPVLEGYYQILGTKLVEYNFESNNYIKVEMKLTLNNVKELYKNSISHLNEGYPDIYTEMEKLWKSENEYKDQLSGTLSDILKRAQELMKSNFPTLSPSLEDIEKIFNLYNIKTIITTFIESIVENKVKLEFDQTNGILYLKPDKNDIIANFNISLYNKFKDNVWKPLNNEFEEKINKLNENYNNLFKSENEFINSIKNIIDDYKSGHAIEGYCNICEKIYHENDITKLRPKV